MFLLEVTLPVVNATGVAEEIVDFSPSTVSRKLVVPPRSVTVTDGNGVQHKVTLSYERIQSGTKPVSFLGDEPAVIPSKEYRIIIEEV